MLPNIMAPKCCHGITCHDVCSESLLKADLLPGTALTGAKAAVILTPVTVLVLKTTQIAVML